MNLSVFNKGIGEFRVATTVLRPLLGRVELAFHFAGTVYSGTGHGPGSKEVQFHWLRISGARIKLRGAGNEMIDLGTAIPDRPLVIRQMENSRDDNFTLALALDYHQIELLEAVRNGGNLAFTISLLARGGMVGGDFLGQDESDRSQFQASVPQSEWIRKLGDAKVADILLFEVRLPANGQSIAHPAIRHLVAAQQLLLEGKWRPCIAECRQFAEELGGNEMKVAFDKFTARRREMTTDERTLILTAALELFAHNAAHSESKHGDLDMDRADAKLALTIAASLASHYFSA